MFAYSSCVLVPYFEGKGPLMILRGKNIGARQTFFNIIYRYGESTGTDPLS
jgi:hypothetical protein